MTGAFLNAISILLGGLLGLALRQSLSLRAQTFFRSALGLAAIFCGLRLVWLSIGGTFLSAFKQIFIALLAIMLGFWIGRLLRLQKWSNRLGQHAGRLIASAQTNAPRKAGGGFTACTVLFCAAPLGWLGAVTDGLSGYFYLLAVKAVMDGLAMMGFVRSLGWPTALSALPVWVFLGGITLACQLDLAPFLAGHDLIAPINTVIGFITCAVALVIFEVRKVELADFLPCLAVAPLLAWLLR